MYVAEYSIDTAKDDNHIGDDLSKTHICKDGQIDEAGRTDAVTIGIGRAVANEIKAQLAFGGFDAAISFTGFGTEAANFCLWIDDGPFRNFLQGLLQEFNRFPHFQDANHVPV